MLRGILYYVCAWTLILLILFFASCHDSKYHYDKFIKKGGKVSCDTITKTIKDTIVINGDTLVIDRPVTVVETKVETKTRTELRYDYKKQKQRDRFVIDSLNKEHSFALKELKIKGKSFDKALKIKVRANIAQAKMRHKEVKKKQKNSLGHIIRLSVVLSFLILLIILALRIIKR